MDTDKDFPRIKGVAEGLKQYHNLESKTVSCSFITGKAMVKIGINKKKKNIHRLAIDFVVVDNKPHLNKTGLDNLKKRWRCLYIVTSNSKHPAFKEKDENMQIIYYKKNIDFCDLFQKLKEHGIKNVTIQSG